MLLVASYRTFFSGLEEMAATGLEAEATYTLLLPTMRMSCNPMCEAELVLTMKNPKIGCCGKRTDA